MALACPVRCDWGLPLWGLRGRNLTDTQFLPFLAVEPRIPVRFHPQNLAEIAAKQTNNLIDLGEGLLEFGIGLVAMADGRLTPTRPL